CDISNFTVIHISATPQCLLCEKHPSTIGGYVYHLEARHHTSLKAKGIYLMCKCGTRYNNSNGRLNHFQCSGREFALRK
ncbi:hypothetical protein PMAYCL1PPCAC_01196, partial [Pristionchus mayeri]